MLCARASPKSQRRARRRRRLRPRNRRRARSACPARESCCCRLRGERVSPRSKQSPRPRPSRKQSPRPSRQAGANPDSDDYRVAKASFSPFEAEGVRGYLHKSTSAGDGLALTHGAGGNANSPLLLAVAEAFQNAGVTVLRCDLPFRQQRPSGPPRPGDAAKDRAGLRAAVAALRKIVSGRVFLSGQSYGGRQSSMLAADEPELVEALMLLSYPLHPPGKPAELRTAHFPRLRTRTLFVQGSHEPFGSIEEMERAMKMIPAPHRLTVVEGAGHDLKRGRFDLSALSGGLSQLVAAAPPRP